MSAGPGTIARPAPSVRPLVLRLVAALIAIGVAAAVLVVGLNRTDEPTVGTPTVTSDVGASRAWMADLIRDADRFGFAVAGVSPTSLVVIPLTPQAAWAIEHGKTGAGAQTADERKPHGFGSTFVEEEPGTRVPGRLPKRD
jgi:hypothetical protein